MNIDLLLQIVHVSLIIMKILVLINVLVAAIPVMTARINQPFVLIAFKLLIELI
jgi:hypothetical protein